MTPVESIVSSYKHVMGLRFDKEVAQSLGLDDGAFSNYTKGRRRLPDMAMVRIAERVNMPLDTVMAATNATFTKTPEDERSFWMKRLGSLHS
jgi:hypothetical protein